MTTKFMLRMLKEKPNQLSIILFMALFLVPISLKANAYSIMDDLHPKFYIGPAIEYRYSDGIVGIDFSSQYSTLIPWILSKFINGDLVPAYQMYLFVVSFTSFIFFSSIGILIYNLTKNTLFAIIAPLAIAILQFHWEYPQADMSSYPTRYFLFGLFILVASAKSRSSEQKERNQLSSLLGAITAFSLIWWTETGLYLGIAYLAIFIFNRRRSVRSRISEFLFYSAAFCGVWVFLLLATQGTGSLSLSFHLQLLSFLWSYSGGFGAALFEFFPIRDYGLSLIALFVSPVITAVGILLSFVSKSATLFFGPRREYERMAIQLATIFSLTLSLKWMNQSLNSLWLSGSATFLLVIVVYLLFRLKEILNFVTIRKINRIFVLILALLPFVFQDGRNPALYGFASYKYFPSTLNHLFDIYREPQARNSQLQSVKDDDVALIKRHTRDSESVAIFGPFDIFFLASAQRHSYFRIGPSDRIFLKNDLKSPCLPDKLFIQKNSSTTSISTNFFQLSRICGGDWIRQFKLTEQSSSLLYFSRMEGS